MKIDSEPNPYESPFETTRSAQRKPNEVNRVVFWLFMVLIVWGVLLMPLVSKIAPQVIQSLQR